MTRIILLLPFLVLLISTNKIQSQESGNPMEAWPEFTVNYDPVEKVRLMLAVRKERNEDTPNETLETTATIIYRIRPLVRNMLFDDDENDNEKKYALSLAANYEYSRTFGASSIRNEHRLMLDATPRYRIRGGILVENRLRLEIRRRDDGVNDYWFRDRVRIEKQFRIKNFRFAPFAYVEPMWTYNANSWNRNLLSAGTEIALVRKRARLDVYYLRKNCDTCDFADVNAIGLNLHLFFGKR
jgi:Protein of unknown function (DUF2490)